MARPLPIDSIELARIRPPGFVSLKTGVVTLGRAATPVSFFWEVILKAPYFPFFVRDWFCSNSVFGMSGEAVKAYLYLLCSSWLEVPRATLPNDDVKLAAMARCEYPKWMLLKDEVLCKFLIATRKEHSGRLYDNKLLEISRNNEKQQRLNNKNAHRTRIKRASYAPLANANANANAVENRL
jgi:hypothetical protein